MFSSFGITKKAYEIAMKIVVNIDADEIMDEVCYALDALEVDDLYALSGKTRDGYVDPNDKSWEMFEESLQPFIDEMIKNQQRGLSSIAKTHCIGIIKGLRMFEEESCSDFKDWVTDAPGEYVDTVVEEWRKGNPSDEDIEEVMSVVKGEQA